MLDALSTKRLHPVEVTGPASVVVLASADDTLYLARIKVLAYAHWPYERCTHDALVPERQLQEKRNPLVCPLLVLAGHIEEDVLPALSPVFRKAGTHPLGPLRQEEEHDIRPLPHHLPSLVPPLICLLEEEV
ncbi:MAG: hypothetical protein MR610_05525 [Olsenella sp.]|nr:hypothetical protein [Olsenella sp.]